MMKSFVLLMLLFCSVSVTFAQDDSCLDPFQSMPPIQPEINLTNRLGGYAHTMAWYSSRCLLIGSEAGLWLYDVDKADRPLMLATSGDRTIASVAVNPTNSTIAFNVADESLVYFLSSDGTVSTIQAEGEAVTSISFSADGSLIAVASSDIEDEMGFYYDARIQTWQTADSVEIANILSDTGSIGQITFSSDNQYLLSNGGRMGYFGSDIAYWDLTSKSKLWDYYDLQSDVDFNQHDPVLVEMVALHGQNLAFGGPYGYLDYDDYLGHGIFIWNVETYERRLEILVAPSDYSTSETPLRDIAFNFAGTVIASTSSDGIVSLWDVNDGTAITQFYTSLTDVLTLSYSPDDHFLAVLSLTDVSVWDVEMQEEYTLLETHNLSETDG